MNNIRLLRKKFAWNQQELAQKLNVQRTNVSKYEREEIVLNADILKKLSQIFNASIDYILNNHITINETYTTYEKDFINKYRVLDVRGKKAVDETLKREYEFITKDNKTI